MMKISNLSNQSIQQLINNVKDKYYEMYNKTDTDEFILCETMEDVNSVLLSCGIINEKC